jgi:non-canonical (house-cleaning) NTP pyrophosphatase
MHSSAYQFLALMCVVGVTASSAVAVSASGEIDRSFLRTLNAGGLHDRTRRYLKKGDDDEGGILGGITDNLPSIQDIFEIVIVGAVILFLYKKFQERK